MPKDKHDKRHGKSRTNKQKELQRKEKNNNNKKEKKRALVSFEKI